MPPVTLRPGARALIVDEDDRILLCRIDVSEPSGPIVVWIAPGGGVEPGETPLTALRRELAEEVGFVLAADPPQVWHQEVVAPGRAVGYDGVLNDYFLVRAPCFVPRGTMTDAELAVEGVHGFRWWPVSEIARYRGPDLFSPRDLGTLLPALLTDGVPAKPVPLGH